MVDENLITVTNNGNPTIALEIIASENNVSVEFTQSIDSVMSVHNVDENAHANIVDELTSQINTKANIIDMNTLLAVKANTSEMNTLLGAKANITNMENSLATKANIATTYTKTETDTFLATKVNTSDTTVTKQGNTFNSAGKLVQLNSSAQLPAVDGILLTNVVKSTTQGLYAFDSASPVSKTLPFTATQDGLMAIGSGLSNGVNQYEIYAIDGVVVLYLYCPLSSWITSGSLYMQKGQTLTLAASTTPTTSRTRVFYPRKVNS